MSDTLKSFPFIGAFYSMGGFFSVTDNHGNKVRGHQLTCAKRAPIRLSDEEWGNLHLAISTIDNSQTDIYRTDGILLVPGGMESPLKAECDRLNAQSHHAPAPPKRGK